MKLAGKTGIVTGSRRGIGRAIARALAKEGAAVAVVDIDQADCQVVSDEIISAVRNAMALKCDVSVKTGV